MYPNLQIYYPYFTNKKCQFMSIKVKSQKLIFFCIAALTSTCSSTMAMRIALHVVLETTTSFVCTLWLAIAFYLQDSQVNLSVCRLFASSCERCGVVDLLVIEVDMTSVKLQITSTQLVCQNTIFGDNRVELTGNCGNNTRQAWHVTRSSINTWLHDTNTISYGVCFVAIEKKKNNKK